MDGERWDRRAAGLRFRLGQSFAPMKLCGRCCMVSTATCPSSSRATGANAWSGALASLPASFIVPSFCSGSAPSTLDMSGVILISKSDTTTISDHISRSMYDGRHVKETTARCDVLSDNGGALSGGGLDGASRDVAGVVGTAITQPPLKACCTHPSQPVRSLISGMSARYPSRARPRQVTLGCRPLWLPRRATNPAGRLCHCAHPEINPLTYSVADGRARRD